MVQFLPRQFEVMFLMLVLMSSLVSGFIIKPQFEIVPDSVQKRSGSERLQNILASLLNSQGQDRSRRGPLWGDFGVGSRWSAGSNAANLLKTFSDLNGPNSPGKRK